MKLTRDEIEKAAAGLPAVLSPEQAAEFIGLSVKTLYEWSSAGRLANCARRRGKHLLIFRDRFIQEIFDGEEW